jgi:hypothetical protein
MAFQRIKSEWDFTPPATGCIIVSQPDWAARIELCLFHHPPGLVARNRAFGTCVIFDLIVASHVDVLDGDIVAAVAR